MPANIDQWIDNMSHASTWGDGLAIHCIAERIGIAITVWRKNMDNIWVRYAFAPKWTQGVVGLRQTEKPVSIVLDNKHYTALLPPKDHKYPKPWLIKTSADQSTILIDLTGGGGSKRSIATPSHNRDTCKQVSAALETHAHGHPSRCKQATTSIHTSILGKHHNQQSAASTRNYFDVKTITNSGLFVKLYFTVEVLALKMS